MQAGILRIREVAGSQLGGQGIRKIGAEEDRLHHNERNPDIDIDRSRLNIQYYRDGTSLYQAWQEKCNELGVEISKRTKCTMEQAVITASPDFFRSRGWRIDAARNWTSCPKEIEIFFKDTLDWFKKYVGEQNIFSACLHLDETTPHMHIDYVPAIQASKKEKAVYAKDENGKIIKDERGVPKRARDETGHIIYEYVEAPARISRKEFWQSRGGSKSYTIMQDDFFKNVSSKYGLARGEVGSGREHTEQDRYKAEKARREAEEATLELEEKKTAIFEFADIISNREGYITDNLSKTITGKTVVEKNDIESIDKLQMTVKVQKDELKKKNAELKTKDEEISQLKADGQILIQRQQKKIVNYEEYKRKAGYWDKLMEAIPKLDTSIRTVVEKIVDKIVGNLEKISIRR